MINEKQKEFLKDCNDLIENKKQETFESAYDKLYLYVKHREALNTNDLKEIKQLHDTEIKYWKDLADFKNNQNIIMSREKDKVISLRNIEITQRKQDYKELQAEIKHEKETSCLAIMKVEDDKKKLKEMQKSLLCSIGNIRGNLANYQINHNEQQLNDIYEICNENLN